MWHFSVLLLRATAVMKLIPVSSAEGFRISDKKVFACLRHNLSYYFQTIILFSVDRFRVFIFVMLELIISDVHSILQLFVEKYIYAYCL